MLAEHAAVSAAETWGPCRSCRQSITSQGLESADNHKHLQTAYTLLLVTLAQVGGLAQ